MLEFSMIQELVERLKNEEDNFVERKPESAKRSELRKTIVAFANSIPEGRTAVLFIGVSNEGVPLGVPNPDKLQKTIREICQQDCYPPIKFRCEVITSGDKDILAVVIPHSQHKPHFAGPAYVREGSQNVIASARLFEELITTRLSKPYEILKWRGKTVTVMQIGKYLGSTELIGPEYRGRRECEVRDCTPHVVTLRDNRLLKDLSEPLDNVQLSYDTSKDRLMLIVRER